MKGWILILLLLLTPPLASEIQKVTLTWTAGLCTLDCTAILEEALRKVPNVSEMQFNAAAGKAVFIWKPNAPFDYSMIKLPAQRVGIGILDVRVKTRGTISHDDQHFFLTSIGDRTRFQLLYAPQNNPQLYSIPYSIETHYLPETLQQKFLDAEHRRLLVTVEGPLFEPWRVPMIPLSLDVQSSQVELPETE